MSRVLLLDADEHHAKQIEWALRSISCQTTTCAETESAISLLHRQRCDVIVVVCRPGMDWDIRIEFIRHAVIQLPEPPRIVCLMRGPYRGPNERVYAARRGFKVVYEQ